MYRLTSRMEQSFFQSLDKYHELFSGGRCQSWEQEELIVKAIQSDTSSQHQVRWREGGHDDKADIKVQTNGSEFNLQIKSGKVQKKNKTLSLSGYRLGRFNRDMEKITDYLNSHMANLISVSCEKINNEKGRQFIYQIYYVDIKYLKLKHDEWEEKGAGYTQTNEHNVDFSLHPSMSWQVWWKIPLDLLEEGGRRVIG